MLRIRTVQPDRCSRRAAACRRAFSPMNRGPATGAGPAHHSVIAGIIRKAWSACMIPAQSMRSLPRRISSTSLGFALPFDCFITKPFIALIAFSLPALKSATDLGLAAIAAAHH